MTDKLPAELERKTPKTVKEYIQQWAMMLEMFKWIWTEINSKQVKIYARNMIILIVIGSGLFAVNPWALGLVIDGLSSQNISLIISGAVLSSILLIISLVITFLGFYFREYIFGEHYFVAEDIITRKFFGKSLGQHFSENNRLTLPNIERGRDKIFNVKEKILFQGIEVSLSILFPFVALFFIDYKAGLLTAGLILLHFVLSLHMNKVVIAKGTKIEKKWKETNTYRYDRWENIEWVKINAKENDEADYIDQQYKDIIAQNRKLWFWFTKMSGLRAFINNLGKIGVLIYGIYGVLTGHFTVGIIYPLYFWTNQVTNNLWQLDSIEREINWMTPSILSMKEALSIPVDIIIKPDAIELKRNQPIEIEFDHVSYAYPDPENKNCFNPVLQDISFKIEHGERVSLIGVSGDGKTTIMRLLLRFFDPTSGSIKINGIDLKDYDLKSILNQFGVIPQRDEVFNGTIAYNLLYGLPDNQKHLITNEELWEIMENLQIDFGKRLNKGLETEVGRKGIKLSGGEAQRLIMGAAVAKKPRFMVIDEATSALDSITEKKVQNGLLNILKDDIGALIIAHRLSTIKFCNKFIFIESNGDKCGRVAATAYSFEELAQKSKTFKQMCECSHIII